MLFPTLGYYGGEEKMQGKRAHENKILTKIKYLDKNMFAF
jgi:hypothetical protein